MVDVCYQERKGIGRSRSAVGALRAEERICYIELRRRISRDGKQRDGGERSENLTSLTDGNSIADAKQTDVAA